MQHPSSFQNLHPVIPSHGLLQVFIKKASNDFLRLWLEKFFGSMSCSMQNVEICTISQSCFYDFIIEFFTDGTGYQFIAVAMQDEDGAHSLRNNRRWTEGLRTTPIIHGRNHISCIRKKSHFCNHQIFVSQPRYPLGIQRVFCRLKISRNYPFKNGIRFSVFRQHRFRTPIIILLH